MPFDALVISQPVSLAEYLDDEGIVPVSMDQLDSHKRSMLQRHRQSTWLTPVPYTLIGATAAAGLDLFVGGGWALLPATIICGLMIGFASALLCAGIASLLDIRLLGKPYWLETPLIRVNEIPIEIATVVRHVRATMPPNAMLIYGELVQDEVVLDPYLILQVNGVRACLGIWMHDTVIACATLR